MKGTWRFNEAWSAQLHLINGWQNIGENNHGKALGTQLAYAGERLSVSFNTFVGEEGSEDSDGLRRRARRPTSSTPRPSATCSPTSRRPGSWAPRWCACAPRTRWRRCRLREAWTRYRTGYDAAQAARERYFSTLAPTFLEAKAAFLAGLFASTSLTHRALRPVAVLSQAVRRLGQGDLGVRAVVEGRDEIAQLGQDFNAMAERLQQYRQSSLGELLQAQAASQATIDSLPDPVVVFGAGGALLNVNRAAEDVLRLSLEAWQPGVQRDGGGGSTFWVTLPQP